MGRYLQPQKFGWMNILTARLVWEFWLWEQPGYSSQKLSFPSDNLHLPGDAWSTTMALPPMIRLRGLVFIRCHFNGQTAKGYGGCASYPIVHPWPHAYPLFFKPKKVMFQSTSDLAPDFSQGLAPINSASAAEATATIKQADPWIQLMARAARVHPSGGTEAGKSRWKINSFEVIRIRKCDFPAPSVGTTK